MIPLNATSPLAGANCRTAGAAVPLAPPAADAPVWLRAAVQDYAARRAEAAQCLPQMRAAAAHFDVEGMQRAVNILFWGRSGSFLLASYLDHHPDTVGLPMVSSQSVYPFLDETAGLSLWEKLIAYPAYSEHHCKAEGSLFNGEFPIAAKDYYAAVDALRERFAERSAEWLAPRARFMQMLHLAHAMALGRGPGNITTSPLIVYCQHWTREDLAQRYVEDFPDGRFIHTIRDPISCVDSWFDRQLQLQTRERDDFATRYVDPAVSTMMDLLLWDRPHRGMEEQTRAIRFEDLHLAPESTMRRLAQWVGIEWQPCLLESTYNGRPYVYQNGGQSWVGANPANTVRRWKNLDFVDRSLVFALLRDDFLRWGYPIPEVFQHRSRQIVAILLAWLLPMKMEITNAKVVLRQQAAPALRRGRVLFAMRAPIFILARRFRMMALVFNQCRLRLIGQRRMLETL